MIQFEVEDDRVSLIQFEFEVEDDRSEFESRALLEHVLFVMELILLLFATVPGRKKSRGKSPGRKNILPGGYSYTSPSCTT